ncbi:papain fold toxin domain-containing protein [Nostoc sp. UHCC 0926]|uniref:papain fold toxin domain-containing protein n=1 Tax=unclassified Nostoc TaxID=2593658 RepID=UPI00235E6C18|nr:papain fold toxin domain-containing protein [Nostoc sp. UHCC 0926]WDD33069.1 papain fold toxin domain-containing protein [Nostoc sp. UHCC 0926]
MMIKASIHSQLSAIAQQFPIFECVPCAIALRQFLIDQNISGKQITLFTGSTEDPFCNIYHKRLRQNISINERHEAIAVEIDGQELIFDNIHSDGISRVDWINNLYCPRFRRQFPNHRNRILS